MRQLLWPGKETPGSHLAASRWCRPRGGCCLPDQMSDKRARSQVREGADPPFYSAPPPRWALFSLFVSQGWDHQSWGHHQLNGIGRSEQKNPNKPHPNSFFYGVRMNVQFRISSLIMSCLHNLHNTSVLPLTDRISVAHTLQVTVGNFCWCQALDRRVGGWEGHSSIY